MYKDLKCPDMQQKIREIIYKNIFPDSRNIRKTIRHILKIKINRFWRKLDFHKNPTPAILQRLPIYLDLYLAKLAFLSDFK